MALGGVLAPGPAPVRNGSLAWRDSLGPSALEMVTFQLEIIGPAAQARLRLASPSTLRSCRGGPSGMGVMLGTAWQHSLSHT